MGSTFVRPARDRPVTVGLGWILAGTLGLGLTFTARAASAPTCEADSGVCVSGGKHAKFEPGKKPNKKSLKWRRKFGKRFAGTLSLTVDGGRGSVFINGRYAGTAPVEGIDVLAGRNVMQVRDGADVLANGMLTVPKDADLEVVVNHP